LRTGKNKSHVTRTGCSNSVGEAIQKALNNKNNVVKTTTKFAHNENIQQHKNETMTEQNKITKKNTRESTQSWLQMKLDLCNDKALSRF